MFVSSTVVGIPWVRLGSHPHFYSKRTRGLHYLHNGCPYRRSLRRSCRCRPTHLYFQNLKHGGVQNLEGLERSRVVVEHSLSDEDPLLFWWDARIVLNFRPDVIDRVAGSHVQRDIAAPTILIVIFVKVSLTSTRTVDLFCVIVSPMTPTSTTSPNRNSTYASAGI